MAAQQKKEIITYRIIEDGKAIECLVCTYVSHNENDIRFKYCGNCHDFHTYSTKKIKKFKKHFEENGESSTKKSITTADGLV